MEGSKERSVIFSLSKVKSFGPALRRKSQSCKYDETKAGITTCYIWHCDFDPSPGLKEIGFHSWAFRFIIFESKFTPPHTPTLFCEKKKVSGLKHCSGVPRDPFVSYSLSEVGGGGRMSTFAASSFFFLYSFLFERHILLLSYFCIILLSYPIVINRWGLG